MSGSSIVKTFALLVIVAGLTACAATESFVQTPAVHLSSVELSKIDFKQQTFLLGINVENPNSFPLPVKMIRYKVMLEDHKFAGGETQCDFTIPAHGDGAFIISVELDLLQSGAGLTSIIRRGASGDIAYELGGSLTLDIPFVPPIDFASEGSVMVQSVRF
jgi:LEA14-like dessication related protein